MQILIKWKCSWKASWHRLSISWSSELTDE